MKTTIPDTSVPCPRDKVNRKFRAPAPNMLWVSDFTYVSTWQGFAYVAFIIDTFANRIVGSRYVLQAPAPPAPKWPLTGHKERSPRKSCGTMPQRNLGFYLPEKIKNETILPIVVIC